MDRLKDIIGEYFFSNLQEYGLNNEEKKDIIALYQDLIQETLMENVVIAARVAGRETFQLKVLIRNRPLY